MLYLRRELGWWPKIFRRETSRLSGAALCRWGFTTLIVAVFTWWAVITPAQRHLESLRQEKEHWQGLLAGAKTTPVVGQIPTLEALPEIIEACREEFQRRGIQVTNLNMERMAGAKGDGNSTGLDYGLLRFQLQGAWEQMVAALAAIESAQDKAVHVREVILEPRRGEVLLQVFLAPET